MEPQAQHYNLKWINFLRFVRPFFFLVQYGQRRLFEAVLASSSGHLVRFWLARKYNMYRKPRRALAGTLSLSRGGVRLICQIGAYYKKKTHFFLIVNIPC